MSHLKLPSCNSNITIQAQTKNYSIEPSSAIFLPKYKKSGKKGGRLAKIKSVERVKNVSASNIMKFSDYIANRNKDYESFLKN